MTVKTMKLTTATAFARDMKAGVVPRSDGRFVPSIAFRTAAGLRFIALYVHCAARETALRIAEDAIELLRSEVAVIDEKDLPNDPPLVA